MTARITDRELLDRYRNLLVVIARDAQRLLEKNAKDRERVKAETNKWKREGILTVINSRNGERARLLQYIGRNRAACRRFFGTSAAEKIAKEEIVLSVLS